MKAHTRNKKKKQNTNWVLSTNETHYELRNTLKMSELPKRGKKQKRK